jgi:hypothetical protein
MDIGYDLSLLSLGGHLNPFRRKRYNLDTGIHHLGELAKGASFRRLPGELPIRQGVKAKNIHTHLRRYS